MRRKARVFFSETEQKFNVEVRRVRERVLATRLKFFYFFWSNTKKKKRSPLFKSSPILAGATF